MGRLMHIDADSLHHLKYQARRMAHALHGTIPPDRVEAELIQKRCDDIFDRLPKVFAVAGDGEVIYDNASPMVLSQGLMPGFSAIVNSSGAPEAVVSHEALKRGEPR
jgi:hypothetical protein